MVSAVKASDISKPRGLTLPSRVWAGVAALSCLAVLAAAAWISPSPAGYGSHTQLGLAPCQWAALTGKPCPTCGMTTAFSHAAHADLLSAVQAQPFGALLALVTATVFWLSVHAAFTGSRSLEAAGGLLRWWVWWVLGLALTGAWVYKMMTWQG